jgi:PAS domain S-box-containing protein
MTSNKNIYNPERIIELLEDGFLRADTDGYIIMANNAIAAMCGYASSKEMIGLQMNALYANPKDRDHMIAEIKAKGKLHNYELELKRKDGSHFWSLSNIKTFNDEKGKLLGTEGVIRDISKRKLLEENLEQTNSVLAAIRKVNQLIIEEKDTAKLLQGICNILTDNKGYFNTWILLLDEDGQFEAAYQAGFGKEFGPFLSTLQKGDLSICAKKAIKNKELVVTKKPHEKCKDCILSALYEDRGGLTSSIVHNNRVLGLIAASIPKKFLSQNDYDLFTGIANDIGLALHNIQVDRARVEAETNLKAANQQLQATNQQLRASEEELRAFNQQLSATEQQLRAANQQLTASEQELLKSKEIAENYLNVAAEIILSLDKNGNITLLNKSGHKLLGYENGSLNGKNWFEHCLPPKYVKEIEEVFKQIMNGQLENVANYESDILTKSGEIKTILWHNTVLQDKNGKITGILSSGEDITERKQAEEELKRKEILLRASVESPVNMVILSLDRDYCYLYFNQTHKHVMEAAYGQTPKLGECIFDYMTNKDDIQRIKEKYDKGLQGESVHSIDVYGEKEKRYYEININPIFEDNKKIIGITSYAQDITEQKRAEQALIESEERLREAESIGQIGHVNWVVAEQKSYWSDEIFRIYERNPNLGVPGYDEIMTMHSPADAKKLEKAVIKALEHGTDYDLDLTAIMPSGKKKNLHIIGRPIKNTRGEVTNIKGTVQDITNRKKTEVALQESEEKYRSIFENAALGIFRSTPEGKYEEVNAAFANILGFASPQKMLNEVSDISKLYKRAEDRDKLKEEFAEKGFVQDYIVEAAHPKKNTVWISINAKQQKKPDGQIYFEGTIQDITERKIAQQALQESEEKFRSYIQNAPIGIFIANQKGKYIEVNPKACELTGYIENELKKLTIPDLIQDEYKQQAKGHFEKLVNTGYSEGEVGYITKTGEKRFWKVDAVKIDDNRFIGFVVDTTEKRLVLDALKISDERYRAAENVGKIGTWEYNIQTTHFWGSNQAKAIYGFDPERDEFTTDEVEKCIPERERVHQTLIDLIEKGTAYNIEFEIHPKDGSKPKFIKSIAQLEKDKHGKPLKVVGVIQDITDQILAEKRLKESETKHKQAQQVAKIGHWELESINSAPKWSDEIFRIFGLEPGMGEPSFTKHDTIIHPDEWPILEKAISEGFTLAKPFNLVFKILRPKNKIGWMQAIGKPEKNENGKIIKMYGTAQDITLQKKAELALKESEERFNMAMDASEDGIFDWNLVDNSIYYSPAWKKMLGYKYNELPNDFSVWENLVRKEDAEKSWKMQNDLINKKIDRFVMEFQMKHKDGHWIDVLSRANAFFDKKGKAIRIVGTHVDITERKKAEKALKESEERFDKAMQAINDGIFDWNIEDNSIYFDSRYYTMAGYKPNEFPHEFDEWKKRVHPDDIDYALKEIGRHVKKETKVFDITYRFLKKDGTWMWTRGRSKLFSLHKDGKPVRMIGTHTDVTARVLAEEKLKESEEKYRLIAENSVDCIWKMDTKLRFEYLSAASKNIFGYEPDEMVGKPLYKFAKWIDFAKMGRVALRSLAKPKKYPFVRFQSKMLHKDGHEVPVEIVGKVLYNEKGKIIGLNGSTVDITERYKAEQEIQKGKELLTATGEMARVGGWGYHVQSKNLYWSEVTYMLHELPQNTKLSINEAIKYFHPDDRPMLENALKEALEKGKPYNLVLRLTTAKGNHSIIRTMCNPIMKNGNVVELKGAIQDITELKKKEEETILAKEQAEKSELLIKTIVNTVPDLIWLKNKEGVYLECNKRFEDFFGQSSNEIIGKTDYDFVNKELADFFRKNDKLAMNAGKPTVNEEEITFASDGHSEILETIKTPLVDKKNKILGILGVGRDITERKKSEILIKESEEKFRKIFMYSSTGIALFSLDLKLIQVNSVYCKMLGYNEKELVGKSIVDITHPDVVEENMELQRKLLAGEIPYFRMEKKYIHKNGHTIYGLLNASIIKDTNNNPAYFVGAVIDITDRKKYEIELKEHKEKLNNIIENSNELFYMHDNEGILVYVSPQSQDIFGVTPEKMLTHWTTFVSDNPMNKEGIKLTEKALKTGKTQPPYLIEFNHARGHKFIAEIAESPLLDDHGKVLGMTGALRDVTEKIKAEEKVRLNEMHLSSLVEHPAGYIVYRTRLNRETGQIEVIKVSPDFAKILGIPEADNENFQKWFANVHPDDLPALMEASEEGMKPPFKLHTEIRNNHPNKGLQWFEIRATGIPYEDNPELIEYANGMILDISEKKKAEKELVKAKQKAEENDKLKSAFLANMSHEIRTPMNGLIGFSDRLKRDNLNDEQKNHYINIIQNSAKSLLNLINDIIDISKIEAGQLSVIKEPCLPGKLLHELKDTFKVIKLQKKKHNINFELNIPPDQEYIEFKTDYNRLKQVLINLLDNSLKFTEIGTIQFGYEIIENRIKFFVKDEGIGISEKDLNNIFNRFQQASISKDMINEGTGLGLSISKGIIELLGGEINVSSTLGKGSTFEFYLPYKKLMTEHKTNIEESEANLDIFSGKSILIAEDDLISQDLYQATFSETSATMFYAYNGKEAVDIIAKNPDIDIILMDIRMPIMDGIEAAKIILKQNPKIKIIAQTAHAMINDKNRFMEIGFVDHFPKPIDMDDLLIRLAKYLSK